MRALEPTRLVVLDSGVWAIDAFQPVAAVLDPRTGALRYLVSWTELPPPRPSDDEPRTVRGDGTSLWVQPEHGGPVARVEPTGVCARTDVGRMGLVAAGGGAGWCAAPERGQLIVRGRDDPRLRLPLRPGVLRRVGRDGELIDLATPSRVVRAVGGPDGLWVLVETEDVALRPLGDGSYDATRGTTWLRLPWDVPVPSVLSLQEHRAAGGPPPQSPRGSFDDIAWYRGPGNESPWDDGHSPVVAAGLRWYVGWPSSSDPDPVLEDGEVRYVALVAADESDDFLDAPAAVPEDLTVDRRMEARRTRMTAYDLTGRLVHDLDLGPGWARSVEPLDDAVALAIQRPGPAASRPIVEVIRVDAATGQASVLLPGASVDVGAACWPTGQRPPDADAFAQEQLRRCANFSTYWRNSNDRGKSRPLARGMTDLDARIVGRWPDAELALTFRLTTLPGLRLRRRWRLFDELGRAEDLDYLDIHLMEDLDTWQLPPTTLAIDGVLDI